MTAAAACYAAVGCAVSCDGGCGAAGHGLGSCISSSIWTALCRLGLGAMSSRTIGRLGMPSPWLQPARQFCWGLQRAMPGSHVTKVCDPYCLFACFPRRLQAPSCGVRDADSELHAWCAHVHMRLEHRAAGLASSLADLLQQGLCVCEACKMRRSKCTRTICTRMHSFWVAARAAAITPICSMVASHSVHSTLFGAVHSSAAAVHGQGTARLEQNCTPVSAMYAWGDVHVGGRGSAVLGKAGRPAGLTRARMDARPARCAGNTARHVCACRRQWRACVRACACVGVAYGRAIEWRTARCEQGLTAWLACAAVSISCSRRRCRPAACAGSGVLVMSG